MYETIAVAGNSGTYISIYLAMALSRIGNKTVIHDRTGNIAFLFLPDKEKELPAVNECKGVTVITDLAMAGEDTAYIIDCFGSDVTNEHIKDCGIVILTTDMYSVNALLLAGVKTGEQVKSLLYIDNYIQDGRYGKKYIKSLAGCQQCKTVTHNLNAQDILYQLNTGHETCRLSQMPAGYRDVIMNIIGTFTTVTEKQRKKIFRKDKK